MPLLEFNKIFPRVAPTTFVASNATLVGDVTVGENSSVWFGAVLRAESEKIEIGNDSNVQDNCVLHTDEGFPVKLEDRVSVGHAAIIHGAVVGRNCLIGMGAILLNGASIGENSMVAAGSLVTQGAKMPEGMLIIGSPAIAKRKLSEEEIKKITRNSESYNEFRKQYLKNSE